MLMAVNRFSDLNMDAIMKIYARTITQISASGHAGSNATMAAQCSFLDDMRDFFQIPGAELFIWNGDGGPVSALRCEPYRDAVLLTYLETAPDLRGRGYAKALVASVTEHYWKQGCIVYSHVNKRNRPSLAVHKSCGFTVISDFARLLDGTVSQNYYTLQYNSTAE